MSTECSSQMSVDGLPCPPMASTRERDGRFIGLYRDPAGRQRSAGTFPTKTKALDAAKALEVDIARGDYVTRSAVSLAEFAGTVHRPPDDQERRQRPAVLEAPRRRVRPSEDRQHHHTGDPGLHRRQGGRGLRRASRGKRCGTSSPRSMGAALLRRSPPLIKHNPVPGVQIGTAGAPVERPYPTPAEVTAITDAMTEKTCGESMPGRDKLMVRIVLPLRTPRRGTAKP